MGFHVASVHSMVLWSLIDGSYSFVRGERHGAHGVASQCAGVTVPWGRGTRGNEAGRAAAAAPREGRWPARSARQWPTPLVRGNVSRPHCATGYLGPSWAPEPAPERTVVTVVPAALS